MSDRALTRDEERAFAIGILYGIKAIRDNLPGSLAAPDFNSFAYAVRVLDAATQHDDLRELLPEMDEELRKARKFFAELERKYLKPKMN